MKILAVDTALPACSAALFDSGNDCIMAKAFEPMATGHAERLAPMVQAVMASAGQEFEFLDRIAATVGPGAFTGLRIGLSFARGLALALSCPVVGISTLQALAATAIENPDALPIAASIDARRGNVYFQLFGADVRPLGGPRVFTAEEAAAALPAGPCLGVGSGAALLAALSGRRVRVLEANQATDAATVARLAGRDENILPPKPLYLRSHDAKPDASHVRHVAHPG
jgi:tRNA threonylcarbamoyladenosine biosynthesis protein TsaB